MGLFSAIKNIFSKPDTGKGKGKKKKIKKKISKDAALKKKKVSSKDTPTVASSKKKSIKKKKLKKKKDSKNLSLKLSAKGKKRKKAEQVTSAPINKTALGFSISLKGENEHAKKRNALRIKVEGLTVHITRLNKQFPVSDISATGLSFEFEKPRVKGGVKLEMDIYLDGNKKASKVMCKVMRHNRGSVGCLFEDLDRTQDDMVHEIVLLGQKQQAARKAAHKDREFKIPT
jgi:hypothetical protein